MQTVAHGGHFCWPATGKPIARYIRRFSQTDNPRKVLRTGTALPLVAAAIDQRLNQRALLQEQRASPLRCVDLVSGNRERITADLLHINRDLARGLNCVRMEEDVGFLGNPANFFHRLNYAGFVVGHHNADEFGVRTQRAADIVRINQAAIVNGNITDFTSHLLQSLAGVQHRMMLNA